MYTLHRLCFAILIFLLPLAAFAQKDTSRSRMLDTLLMGEVVISEKTAVRVHGDTISYRVDSFITDPLANTEDVLKRLPGVEVSRDGKITIQGKEVNKMFINGKEYFADDLRSVIQNLPAEIIEKIQVADWRDEDAKFTGNKENTAEKVINLQLKKKYAGGVYGTAGAGYGTKQRYQGGLFANYMDGGALRLTLMGNASNTGMSDVSNDNSGSVNNTSWRNPGVRTEQRGSFNFSYDKDKKFQLNGSYSFNNNNNYLQRSSYRTTYLPGDSLLLQEQDNEQNSQSAQHNLHLRSKYKFGEKSSYRSNLGVRAGTQKSNRDGDDVTYNSDGESVNFRRISTTDNDRKNASVNWSNSLMKDFTKKGRTLLINLNINYSNSSSEGNANNSNLYLQTQTTNDVLNRSNDSGNNFNTQAGFTYTEPFGEYNSVALSYNNNYAISNNDREVTVANNGTYIEDTNQSRGYKNINNNNKIGLLYQYSKDKINAGIGFDAEPYSRNSVQTSGNGTDVQQTGINYFPRLFSRYDLSKTSQLSLSYNGSITPPSITQLQPIPDFTDSLNIYIGNPQLRPEVNNNIRLRFNNNNVKTGRNVWLNVNVGWMNSKIINKTELTGSRRTTTPVNADGNYTLGSSFNLSEQFIKKVLTGSFSLSGNLTNNVTIINGQLQEIVNYTLTPGFRLTCYTNKWYEGSVNYNYRWNKVQGGTQTNNLMEMHDLTHDGTFIFPKGIRLSYYLSYMVNKGLAQGFQQEFFLANLMLDKTFTKPKGLSLRLHAFDVFNNYPTVQRNIADNYYEDVAVNRIGSYLMFSIVYKFTSFPEKKKMDEVEE